VIPPPPQDDGEGLDGLKTDGLFDEGNESEEKSDEGDAKDDEPTEGSKGSTPAPKEGGKHKGRHGRR
jgi:hypothetical protein